MPPNSKQEIAAAMANRIFEEMVSELQFDTVLRARQDAEKAKRPCRCCGTYCSLPHREGLGSTVAGGNLSSQTNGSQPKSLIPSGSSGTGTPTKDNTNTYLTCPICKRPFASNRVAAHLSSCMGISNGSRRGARNAKAKLDDRSASPYVDLPDEVNVSASQKAKSKKKDSNVNGKRPSSPSLTDTPTKKGKKQKTGTHYSEIGSVSSSTGPSGLRKSSTVSSVANEHGSPSPSAYSSPNTPVSTDSGGSNPTQAKSLNPKPKLKPPVVRGPPGSSKGRSIAAARLHGDSDISK